MNKGVFFLSFIIFSLFVMNSCSILNNPTKIKSYANISTSEGDFVIGLYEGTPLHKENFISNCNEHIYDSLLVYSSIPFGLYKFGLDENVREKDFMNSNFQEKSIVAEKNPKILHKTGAVGMMRLPNNTNSDCKSDKQLFFLVDGIKTDEKLLKTLEAKRNAPLIAEYITRFLNKEENHFYKDSLDNLKIQGKTTEWKELYLNLTEQIKPNIERDGKTLFHLSAYQIKTYTETGGAPIYDNQYTVFGEIVYGIEILEMLSKQKTDLYNKPKKNIYILSSTIITKKELKTLIKN